jgi:O-acetyl-ADP-ribose deacetylase (regulator of RNase III)
MQAFLSGRVAVKTGDITEENADAIVNAANSSLLGGGGVDGAIHRAGGPLILEECRKIRSEKLPDGLPEGDAVITSGGELPAKYVIHTVGPVWQGGHSNEQVKLASCYKNSLKIADEKKLKTICFPAISTGLFGFPQDKAAKISSETVKTFLNSHEFPLIVIFIFFSQKEMSFFINNQNF